MDKNSTEIEGRLQKIIDFLAARTSDNRKSETQLRKFAELNDGRCYKLMKTIMDPNSDAKTISKCKVTIKLTRLRF